MGRASTEPNKNIYHKTRESLNLTRDGLPIVTIQKEWMTWGDSYELSIRDPRDEIVALAVVLTIDCVLAAQSNH